MTELGPVSAALEADLRELARQHGVIVWLDKDGAFTGFADRLRARGETDAFPIPVRCLRGSYLELMLALEDLEDGVGMTALVVHVPGLNQDTIAETPLFELYRAGRRYQRALPTLVREAALGRATPEAIEGFLTGPDVTLDRADAWLGGVETQQPGGGPDLGALGPDALFEALLPGGSLAAQLDQPAVSAAVWSRASALLGVHQGWEASWGGASAELRAGSALERASSIADSLAGWALCTEFVHDLRRVPKDEWLTQLRVLPRPAIAACQRLASHLRARHPERYRGVADEYERGLVEEVKHATADDLGKIDTFRFEDRTVLAAALDDRRGRRAARPARQAARDLPRLGGSPGCRVQPTVQQRGLPSGIIAAAAHAVRRGGRAGRDRRAHRVLHGRRAALRDGRAAGGEPDREPGQELHRRDRGEGPPRRASHRDRGGHEPARARRAQRQAGDRAAR